MGSSAGKTGPGILPGSGASRAENSETSPGHPLDELQLDDEVAQRLDRLPLSSLSPLTTISTSYSLEGKRSEMVS